MSAKSILPLVILGALLGTGAYYLKAQGDKAERALRGLPKASYEACLDSNAFIQRYDLEEQLRDCDAEYFN